MKREYFHTRSAYLWSCLLTTPFWALYNLLPFILFKELKATPLQIALFFALKPIASIFSVYWSSLVENRPDRLVSNVIWAGFFRHLPFLFTPFIHDPWYFLFASSFYMLFKRGSIPGWMEILKLNLPLTSRQKIFSYGCALDYLGSGILSLFIGWLLDEQVDSWTWLFPVMALSAMLAIFYQIRIPIKEKDVSKQKIEIKPLFFQPLKSAWDLIKKRSDFRAFQLGFMLGGAGLMIMQPALPSYFSTVLNLSYIELTAALSLCKGVGYAFTVPFWTRWINRVNIYLFCALVTSLAGIFSCLLLFAPFDIAWIFVAYLLYGVMQAGSELSWHLSGPMFAGNEDSSRYTNANILSVGLRGCVAPAFGSFLCSAFSCSFPLYVGGILCFFATWQLTFFSRKLKKEEEIQAAAIRS